ncbi:MAG: M43 family zinc metalloprotease [Verrucomicrobiota bacterium JB023]|nr:M43 family zinc metalloprotease [Verrucomicrobiota bacterium JB023]
MKRFILSLLLVAPAAAEIQVRLSIKAILSSNGSWPSNTNTIGSTGVNLNSETAVRDNVDWMNSVMREKRYPFRFFLREDTVYTISGQADPYYTMDARSSATRNAIEDAALDDKTTWKWHDDSINIYINDTRSGYCSRPTGGRSAITVGAGAYEELILHEIGHFFNLSHTHSGDGDGNADDWADGDGLSETLPDDADASAADINAQYPGSTQETRDNLIFNVMSYHQPQDRFVWQQRQEMIEVMNDERDPQASGEGFFLADDGADSIFGVQLSGRTYAQRLKTLENAVSKSTSSNDVILIDGTIEVTDGAVFSTPHVWMKWRDDAILR